MLVLEKSAVSQMEMLGYGLMKAEVRDCREAHQSLASQREIVGLQIPFAFNVGTQSFEPGQYILEYVMHNTIALCDDAGDILINIATRPVESETEADAMTLIFTSCADRYYLAQIWWEGATIGRELVEWRSGAEQTKNIDLQIALRVDGEGRSSCVPSSSQP
jgi:hypothetical protein